MPQQRAAAAVADTGRRPRAGDPLAGPHGEALPQPRVDLARRCSCGRMALRTDSRRAPAAAARERRRRRQPGGRRALRTHRRAERRRPPPRRVPYRPIGYVESCFVGEARRARACSPRRAREAAAARQHRAAGGGARWPHGFQPRLAALRLPREHQRRQARRADQGQVHPAWAAAASASRRAPHRPNAIGLTCARPRCRGRHARPGRRRPHPRHPRPRRQALPAPRHPGRRPCRAGRERGDASLIAEVAFSDDAAAQLEEAVRAGGCALRRRATARRATEHAGRHSVRPLGPRRAPPGPPHPDSPGALAHARRRARAAGERRRRRGVQLQVRRAEDRVHVQAHVLVTRCEAGVSPTARTQRCVVRDARRS